MTTLKRKELVLLYPLSIVLLLPSWIIEPRYHLVPILLFIVFRERQSRAVEFALIVLGIALSPATFLLLPGREFLFINWGEIEGTKRLYE